MDAKSEEKALSDAVKHAKQFRQEHNIPDEEWNLAEAHLEDMKKKALDWFWELWKNNGVIK